MHHDRGMTTSDTPDQVTVTLLPDGPIQIVGPITITDGAGTVIAQCDKAFLCRCGQSAKKPYCDGTHRKVGFTDGQNLPEGTGKA